MTTNAEARDLIATILDEFGRTGLIHPRPQDRGRLIRLLNGFMTAEPDAFLEHLGYLGAEVDRRGNGFACALLVRASPDIPDEAIRRTGFAAADDDVLADLFVSSAGLTVMYDFLIAAGSENRAGGWYYAAVLKG